MGKGRPIFRLLVAGLLLALLPTGCCCPGGFAADVFAGDHHDAGAVQSHSHVPTTAGHDTLARATARITADCVTAHEETAACQGSPFLITSKANRLPGNVASIGPNSIAIRLRQAAIPDSVPTIGAPAFLRQPARLPPRTLVALQVLHLT